MNQKNQNPEFITSVPGMPEVAQPEGAVLPDSGPITIENPTAMQMRNAIGSPYKTEYGPNVHGGPNVEQEPLTELPEVPGAEIVGGTVVGSTVEIIDESEESAVFVKIGGSEQISEEIRAAAVRPNQNTPPARTSDRDGYWTRPTDAQIKIDPDLAKQSKYFS